jgi:iron-sulfur cluster repair protein YtfE (RIC family)
MLVQLGRSRSQPRDLVDMLLACHARIRSFIALARAAARREGVPEQEIAEGCRAVDVYFREAFPLHLQDEEQSILPRLHGQTADLDACLNTMRCEHAEHEPKVAELLAACAELRRQPRNPQRRARLEAIAGELELDFARHLALEEEQLFKAVAQLAPSIQSAIVAEIRERRLPATSR